jgi:outer membrane lipoprotein SlyB
MTSRLATLITATTIAIGVSACASDGYAYRDSYRDGYAYDDYRNARCGNCGVVARIDADYYGRDRDNGAEGAVVGALIGAAVGNQVGSGDGRRAATVAGAVAGGVAGKHIDERNGSRDRFEVVVRMDSGRTIVLEQRDLNGIREGARVVVDGGVARLR